ncbi:MAG TPA: hypothetical protein VFE94_00465, partial [Candidatus Paceibacterota bacterium]|nr:hypothetical protein [Candidatus Paceibacterota bacterium]
YDRNIMSRRIAKKEGGLSRVYFEVVSKLSVKIRTTEQYWNIITKIKHPVMRGKERVVQKALQEPNIIRRSRVDKNVYLFYRKYQKHHLVVVVRHLNKREGFIITTYITDIIKEGIQVWPKQSKTIK